MQTYRKNMYLCKLKLKKYRCGLAVLITSAASCNETVK